jgi:hypothetical protein
MHLNFEKSYSVVYFILVFSVYGFGQTSSPAALQMGGFSGNILPHSEDIRSLSYSSPWGINAALMWQNPLAGTSYQHPLKTRKGFRFQYVNFNNPEQLGYTLTLSAFTEPMFGSNRKIFISMPLDGGLCYLSKVYHPTQNPENLFFSSPISFFLSAGLQLNYRPTAKILWHGNVQYQHISNGGIQMPNKGMNFLTYQLGLSYYWKPAEWKQTNILKKPAVVSKWMMEAYILGSAKTYEPTNKLMPLFGFQTSFIKPINYFHHAILSTEGIYNTYRKEYYKSTGESYSAWEQGLLLGYGLRINKTSFHIYMGTPITAVGSNDSRLYQRYMLVQTFGKKWLLAGSLKANAHVADIFDLRLGYRLTR